MNVILRTNTSNPQLELRDVKRFKEGSGYISLLVVRSGAFQAEKFFYFEEPVFEQFLEQIIEMNRTLSGKAILKPYYEPEYIAFEMLTAGHVQVTGELFEYSAPAQHLEFGFETDQTCLSPLITDLQSCKRQG
ncbi:MAG TPA: hypothetical protein VEV81_06235 [Pyrinomonadaceae bacterium]|jgi:hypothetical protein|nr:hypothetical protein [Pyrinomonadaceae bacterium]